MYRLGSTECFEVAALSSGGKTVNGELTPEKAWRGTEVVQARELRDGKCQKSAGGRLRK